MQFKAKKCKPTTVFSAVSALSHVSIKFGFVLPTQKFDGNALLYRQITNMKRGISLTYRQQHGSDGATFDEQRATQLGAASISLLLSQFQVRDRRSFLRLRRRDRHHLAAAMMQHTCGMRFENFLSRSYRVPSFVRDAYGTFSLVTDWHRYSGRRSYCLEFALVPRWSCLKYIVNSADGVHVA